MVAGVHAIAFLLVSSRLRSMPQRQPAKAPSLRTTRWHGMASAIGFAAQAPAIDGLAAGMKTPGNGRPAQGRQDSRPATRCE
jgi:hypothetical protein